MDVQHAIHSLKKPACYDVYDMNSIILDHISAILIKPLTYIFNLCVSQGIFPNCFKLSRVVPIFKKGDVNCPSDYRPISIVPVFGKIFEVIIKNSLVQYFERNSLLDVAQYGFREGKSTVQAVVKIVQDIVEGLEAGEQVELVLCDLSKAFDCVSHDLLIEKLRRYGIRGDSLRLIESYMSHRQQSVSFDNDNSNFKFMTNGVPQGSILGPILFIIYMNE